MTNPFRSPRESSYTFFSLLRNFLYRKLLTLEIICKKERRRRLDESLHFLKMSNVPECEVLLMG